MLIDVVAVAGSYAAFFAPIGLVALTVALLLDVTVFTPPDCPHAIVSANPSVRAHRYRSRR